MVRPATFHVAFGMSQGCSWPRWSPTGHLANPECPPQRCRSGVMLSRGWLSRPVWMMVGLATCVPCVRRGRCMNVHATQHTNGRAALTTRGAAGRSSAAASRYLIPEHQTDIWFCGEGQITDIYRYLPTLCWKISADICYLVLARKPDICRYLSGAHRPGICWPPQSRVWPMLRAQLCVV